MKKIFLLTFPFHEEKGEIAALLTIAALVIMAIGIVAGNKLVKTGGKLFPQAASCSNPGEWGVPQCGNPSSGVIQCGACYSSHCNNSSLQWECLYNPALCCPGPTSPPCSCSGVVYTLIPPSPENPNQSVAVNIDRSTANMGCGITNVGLLLDGVTQGIGLCYADGTNCATGYHSSVNSGTPGTYTLIFTVNNGANQCNSTTFQTLAPTPTLTLTPVPLPTAIPTATPVPPTSTPTPIPIPNCSNVIVPTGTLFTNTTYTISASYANGAGIVDNRAIQVVNNTCTTSYFSQLSSGGPGIVNYSWTTPNTPGTYYVSCRAWNDSIAECQGYNPCVDGPPRYLCTGPQAFVAVSVVAPTSTPTLTPTRTPTPVLPSATVVPPTVTNSPTGIVCTRKVQADANCDNKIDGVDYSIWLNTQCHPQPGTGAFCTAQPINHNADFNNDGNRDDTDYQIWIQFRNT